MNKKNLLLIINQLHGGGAQKVIANLSIELSHIYDVTLVVYNDIDKIVFPYAGELVTLNLPYSENTHNNSFLKRLVRFFSLVRQIRKLKKNRNIEVSISFLEASNIVNILSSRGERLIISVRSFLSLEFDDNPRLRIFKKIISALYNRADYIVAPAALAKEDLIKNFNVRDTKVGLVYNFVNLQHIQSKAKEPIEPEISEILLRFPVIVNVGRITSPKAQWLLPSVLKKVKSRVPNAKMLILGEGPLITNFLEESQLAGLKACTGNYFEASPDSYDIYLPGFRDNIYPYLSHSSVFVKSSVYEGFPNVIIEAMACGLPVVSSDCLSGPREILSPGSPLSVTANGMEPAEYGILTPVYNMEADNKDEYATAAAEALIELLTNEERKTHYAASARNRAEHFRKDIIIKQWINIIENKA